MELGADCSVLPDPPERAPVPRIATTVTSAPSAAPANAHGNPAFHPVVCARVTAAPHLWQNLAVAESGAPHA